MVIYSHSRLSTFEQCPLKYKFRYIDEIIPELEQTIEAFLGGVVHETLEFIYSQACNRRTVSLDEAIEYYIRLWNEKFKPEIRIIKQELNSEYYFNLGIKFIIDYFSENYPFSDNTIAVEKMIVVDLDPICKYKIRGYIDRLVHDKEKNIFEIHDYKTAGFLKSQEELDCDRQLALYSIGIKNSFLNVSDIRLIWHFLAHNKRMESHRTEEQLEKLKQDIILLIDKIEATTEFNPCQGVLCNWCEYQEICGAKNQQVLDKYL